MLTRKSALRAALARLLVKRNVSNADELLPPEVKNSGMRFLISKWTQRIFVCEEHMYLISYSA